jgi:hypothetical protein
LWASAALCMVAPSPFSRLSAAQICILKKPLLTPVEIIVILNAQPTKGKILWWIYNPVYALHKLVHLKRPSASVRARQGAHKAAICSQPHRWRWCAAPTR